MFDVGFSEILLTSAIALVVLGPERLPKVARQVGNWMGRARAMARQLSEQLEREVNTEEIIKQQKKLAESFSLDTHTKPERRIGPPEPHSAAALEHAGHSGETPPPLATVSTSHEVPAAPSIAIPPPAQQPQSELHESHDMQYLPDAPQRDTSPEAMHANDLKSV